MNNNSFEDVRYVAFNQDCTSLSVGTNKGCKLFSLLTLDSLDLIYTFDKDDVYIIERLFSSSLVVLVNSTSPRKLKVFHFKKGTEICSYNYANTILSVKLNRARLIVCLEEALFIHNIKDMKVLHTIRDTPSNQHGVIALTTNYISPPNLLPTYSSDTYQCFNNNPNNISYLAYPGSNSFGEVQIFDTINLRAVTMIPAHENPVAALAFNSNGTKIATASEKGTVIRVFSTLDGTKLHEFRRGMKRCVTVFSLHFSPDSIFLALSSNTETVHVFKLEMEDGQRCDGNILGLQRTSNSSLDHHHHPSNKTNANYYYQQNSSHSTAGGSIKSVATTASSVFTSIVGSNTTSALYDYFNKALTTTSNYLPGQVGDILTQNRSFATAYLPPNPLAQPGQPSIVTSLGISTPLSSKNICAIISPLSIIDSPYYQGKSLVPTEHNVNEKCFDKYYLVVASYTGTLYMYEFDKDIGGDCSFVKSFRFTSSPKLKGGTTDLIMSNEDYAEQRQQTINVPISEDAQIVLTPISATPSSSPYNNSKTSSTQGGSGGCYQTTTAGTNLSAKLKNPEKIILKTAAPPSAAISIADDFSNGGLINEYSSNNLTTTFPLPVISSAPSPTTFLENNDQKYPPAIFSYATALNKKQ